jgi:carbonic anhydrase
MVIKYTIYSRHIGKLLCLPNQCDDKYEGEMMKKILVAATAAAMLLSVAQAESHAGHAKHWDYTQNGPATWGEVSKTCAIGNSQSPVNIVTGKTVKLDEKNTLTLNEDAKTTAKVIDNGHSIKVTPKKGGSITLKGENFDLLQFHFHGKSEHTVDGKPYEMVAHMVHQNSKTKQLAVVAVFFKEGKKNPILDTVIEAVGKGDVTLNPKDLLPSDTGSYYHYIGSLTTPPCSENVEWYLLKQPAEASKEQIEAFRKYYHLNERPTQKLNDRKIEANQ